MSGMLSTSREALIIRSDPTLAAYIAELHDTGHDATGSAESGSTIKIAAYVRSASSSHRPARACRANPRRLASPRFSTICV